MKQNKKGFTLVELLAVIVILAIIALIATPIILGVIDQAKEGAAKNSALGYIDALEKDIALKMVTNSTATVPTKVTAVDVSVKGSAPTSIDVVLSNGVVTSGTMVIDGYTVSFVNGQASIVK